MDPITRLMEALGSPGAGLAVALENVFPPVPSEVILPLAGFTAGQGKISIASPVGKAVYQHRVGEEVDVEAPAGTFRVRIESIAAP